LATPLISLGIVLRYTGKIVTIVTLCCAIGLHWVALQSVAWTTMLFEYSKHAPLRQAIAQTIDGSHPCAICHAVTTGKKSEKKSEFQAIAAWFQVSGIFRFY
jgi:siroheme synthase